jgi:hypothetical protein
LATSLSPAELLKYSWRAAKFIFHYENGTPFKLQNETEVTLVFDPQVKSFVETENQKALVGAILQDKEGNKYKFSDLAKTGEFGGKGKGFSIRIEQEIIASINNSLEALKLAKSL